MTNHTEKIPSPVVPNVITHNKEPNFLMSKLADKALQKIVPPPHDEANIDQMTEQLAHGYSVIGSNDGGRQIYRKIFTDNKACDFAFGLGLNPIMRGGLGLYEKLRGKDDWGDDYRQLVVNLFGNILPYQEVPINQESLQNEDKSRGKLIVCNHPSSNEPPMSAIWAARRYPDKKLLMPVDLPRFEAVAKWHSALAKAWVNTTPVIPPEIFEYMGQPDEFRDLKLILERRYFRQAVEYLKSGDAVVIAQQAAMYRCLFADQSQYETGKSADGRSVIKPIGSIFLQAKKAEALDSFDVVLHGYELPAGAEPYNLNIGKKYNLHIGEIDSAEQILDEASKAGAVDHHLLRRLADDIGLPPDNKYPEAE